MIFLSNTARARVGKNAVKNYDKYTTVNLSTSKENRNSTGADDKYTYSNWSFVRLVGKAHEFAKKNNIKEGDILVLTTAFMTNEPYDNKEGVRVWNNLQIVVSDVEFWRKAGSAAEPEEDDELPDYLKG